MDGGICKLAVYGHLVKFKGQDSEMVEALAVLVPVPIPSTPTRWGDVGLIRSPTVVLARSVSRKYKRLHGRPSPLRDSMRLRRSTS